MQQTITDLLTHTDGVIFWFSIAMAILAGIDLTTFFLRKRRSHIDFKSSIISLGILGTFIGVSRGLFNFNADDIEQSIPELLSGLKTAFVTSIVGLSFSIALSILQRLFDSRQGKSSEGLLTELIVQMKIWGEKIVEIGDGIEQLNRENKKFRNEIKQEFEEVNKILSSSLQALTEGASKEIVKALNDSIKGFNENLTEQFGDNFKQLNEACHKLVEWQNQHGEEVERAHKELTGAVQSISSTEKLLASIADKNEETLGTYKNLEIIIKTYDNQVATLNSHMQKYADLSDQVKAMLEGMENKFQGITERFSEFTKTLGNMVEEKSEEIKLMQSAVNQQSQVLKKLSGDLVMSINKMEDTFVSITETLSTKYQQFSDEAIAAKEAVAKRSTKEAKK